MGSPLEALDEKTVNWKEIHSLSGEEKVPGVVTSKEY